MSRPWFRVYTRMTDDEKIRLLAVEDRWYFTALMCCKGQGILDEDGPMMRRKVAIKLDVSLSELSNIASRLAEVGLISEETLEPIAWGRLQFTSDIDTTTGERQKRYRDKRKKSNALRNGHVTRTDSRLQTPDSREQTTEAEIQEAGEDSLQRKNTSQQQKRQPQLKRPDDVSEDTWDGFVSLRRAKKAPISDAALKGIRREADKARVSMDEALQTCCARGWTGFKAEWLTDDRVGGQRVNGNTAPNSYVGLSQKDYGKTRMGGFLERQMKAKLNGGDK